MDAKIPPTVWSEPDLEPQPSEVLLTLFWIKTHPSRNDCGAYRFSPGRFTGETRLEARWHEETLAAFPSQFVREGHWVLYLPFIRECLQLGEVVGKNGGVNKGAQALGKPTNFPALPRPLQEALLATYPEFSPVMKPLPSPCQALAKPLPSPCQALPAQEVVLNGFGAGNQSLADGKGSETAAAPEGLAKGFLPTGSPRAEQSRAEQSRAESGECEGGRPGEGTGGALVPTEEDVLAFARTYTDAARGWEGIPEAYALDWFSWRMTPKAGPMPRDWQGDLRRRFVAAVLEKRATPLNLLKNGGASKRLAELRNRLAVGQTSPQERADIREEIQQLEAGGQKA